MDAIRASIEKIDASKHFEEHKVTLLYELVVSLKVPFPSR